MTENIDSTPLQPAADESAGETPQPKDVCQSGKFFGIIPLSWRYDLTSIRPIRWLLKQRWFPMLLVLVNVFVFMIILIGGVMGGFSLGNFSFTIMIVWILWWVLLMMVLVPIFSRAWCLMCPLPTLGESLQRLRIFGVTKKLQGFNLKWPKRLSNMWVMNFLFLVTTFFSGFFTVRPLATFYLLGGIIVVGVILSLVFEKRSFCLYVCPVSGFQGLYANMGMIEIRAKNKAICDKHPIKTCEVGNKKGYGCPWLLKPYEFKRNTYCGMCMECFKTCPFDNMSVNLRPPGTDLLVDQGRGYDEAWKGFIMMGVAILFYVAMMGRWGWMKDWVRGKTLGGWLTFVALHAALNMLVIPGIYFIFIWLSKTFSGVKDIRLKKVFVNFSYILIPLGLAAWIAFSFGFLFPNGSYILHIISDPFARGWDLFGTAGTPWTPIATGWTVTLQLITLFVGFLIAADYGYKLSLQTYVDKKAARAGYLPVLTFLIGVTLFFGWLYGG